VQWKELPIYLLRIVAMMKSLRCLCVNSILWPPTSTPDPETLHGLLEVDHIQTLHVCATSVGDSTCMLEFLCHFSGLTSITILNESSPGRWSNPIPSYHIPFSSNNLTFLSFYGHLEERLPHMMRASNGFPLLSNVSMAPVYPEDRQLVAAFLKFLGPSIVHLTLGIDEDRRGAPYTAQ
jgi:hypothetical protein